MCEVCLCIVFLKCNWGLQNDRYVAGYDDGETQGNKFREQTANMMFYVYSHYQKFHESHLATLSRSLALTKLYFSITGKEDNTRHTIFILQHGPKASSFRYTHTHTFTSKHSQVANRRHGRKHNRNTDLCRLALSGTKCLCETNRQ